MIDSDESMAMVCTPPEEDTLPCIEPPNVNLIVLDHARYSFQCNRHVTALTGDYSHLFWGGYF